MIDQGHHLATLYDHQFSEYAVCKCGDEYTGDGPLCPRCMDDVCPIEGCTNLLPLTGWVYVGRDYICPSCNERQIEAAQELNDVILGRLDIRVPAANEEPLCEAGFGRDIHVNN